MAKRSRFLALPVAIFSLCIYCRPTSAQTLQERLERAVRSFSEGTYSQAYWEFEIMELDFGSEPEFTAPTFQAKVLPVRGYAALMADRPTDALVYFESLLSEHAPTSAVGAFSLYNIAVAQAQTNSLAAAADSYRRFQLQYPDTNEAALACLQEANLLYRMEETEQSISLLDNFYQSDAPFTLRMQARLRALQIASESGNTQRAQHILFETNWNVAEMPDIAVLSFAALDAGDLLLANGQYAAAIQSYQLSYPRALLIKKQRERLEATERSLKNQSTFASSIWKSHSRQLVTRLERQLNRLETMEDYTPGLYLRSGQAYLLNQRYREAAILFRSVALSDDFTAEMRAEAHYRWILALCEGEKWVEARKTAQDFLDQHPGHTLAQSALFLIARSYQGEGQYREAIAVLDDLILNFPKDKQAARWYFTRGYNYCILEELSTARQNFTDGLERFPNSQLVEQMRLWHGLTYFFEKNYEKSLSVLTALQSETKQHPIQAEVTFRIANIHYAQREYASALEIADQLINQFPDHHRVPEMQALRGDIYMGLGELIRAANAFKQVPSDDSQLYDYAVFQTSKIYKALERYDLLRKHLQSYVNREDADERPRVSEALYWIGWSLQQEDRSEEAFPIFEASLKRFGNNPEARAVESILSAYGQLYQRTSDSERGSFKTWLYDQTQSALEDEQLTWFARLTLFTAEQQRQQIDEATAEATLLSIHRFVPLEQQDPATLAKVGLVLAERGYGSADDYFERILEEYPKRFERAAAYYGKARLAFEQSQLDAARRWLIKFLEETPTHPLAPQVRLLSAGVLTQLGLYDAARASLNEILQIKEMRGRPHAMALAGLARLETELEDPKRAIAYWQRLYTLYRAYPELILEAYWESAQRFIEINDIEAARNTLDELLKDPRLSKFPQYAKAKVQFAELESQIDPIKSTQTQQASIESEVSE